MKSINKVTLLGHVGADPKIVSTSGGTLIANFSLATSFKMKAKDGRAASEVVEWHKLSAFGRTAEIIRDYVRKGAGLYVEGNLQTRTWDKDGEKRYSTEIVVREMSMLPSAGGRADGDAGGAVEGGAVEDEDIPF